MKGHVAGRAPIAVEVEAGRIYWWCTCGRSMNQPFCDGKHKDTAFTPLQYEAKANETLFFCACKHTATPPLCDSTHNKLP